MPHSWRSLLLILLVMPLLMASNGDAWREVAEGDIAFAQDLADEGIKFDSVFRERLIEGKVAGCMPRPSKIRGLDPWDRHWIERYCFKVCVPWDQTWAEILSACDRIWVPRWCKAGREDLAVEHIGLRRYFETMTAAIIEARTPLERSNIMEVIANRLNDDVLRHHPSAPIDTWVAGTLSAYLKTATPDEVIQIAEPICGATFGHGDRVAREFVEYRDRPGAMTDDQRCAMKGILARKDRWLCAGYSGGSREKTADEKASERHALEASVLTPENLALLSQRIDAFYRLESEGRCSDSYEYMALDSREGGYSRDDWDRTCEHSNRDFKLLNWRVNDARAFGNWVKVTTLENNLHRTGSQKGQVWSREWETYWIFEDNTWNQRFGHRPEGWNDKQTIEVHLPAMPARDSDRPGGGN